MIYTNDDNQVNDSRLMDELIERLTKEFKEYKDDDGGNTSDDTLMDDFADAYTGNIADAMALLDGLDTCDVLDLIVAMNDCYEQPSLMLDWMEDKQELANEIVGYLLRTNIK